MTALTEFMPAAVNDSMGSSVGRLRGKGMTTAVIAGRL
jgi:hypothetical protein